MTDYINPIDGTKYTDEQHVDIVMFEYDKNMRIGQFGVEGGDYLSSISHIYDFLTLPQIAKGARFKMQIL